MKKVNIVFLTILFLFINNAEAQKHILKSIEWKKKGVLPATNGHLLGFAGVVAGVSNDVFIVGGGANFPDSMPWLGGKKKYYDDLYVYKKNTQDSLVLFRSLKLPFPLGYAACVSTKNGIVVAGGENAEGIRGSVLLLQWDTATQEIITKYLPSLPYPVTGAGIAESNGIIYLAGGDMQQATSNHLWRLDLNNTDAEWKEMPSLPQPTSHAVFVVDATANALYLVGGRRKNEGKPSTLYNDVFAFDLQSMQWKKKRSLPYALSAGTGAVVGNNIVLFGGDTGETFHKTEEIILAIAHEKNDEKKRALMLEKIKLQSGHPGFCGKEWAYDVNKNQWKVVGCIPFDVPVTTVAVPWSGEVIIAGGEIRAGVRTTQFISAKMILQ